MSEDSFPAGPLACPLRIEVPAHPRGLDWPTPDDQGQQAVSAMCVRFLALQAYERYLWRSSETGGAWVGTKVIDSVQRTPAVRASCDSRETRSA